MICGTDNSEKLTMVTEVGLETLRTSCEIRHRDDLLSYLDSCPGVVRVHASCRKPFTSSREIKRLKLQLEAQSSNRVPVLRSADGSFMWKSMCFICGASAATSKSSTRRVCTLELGTNVLHKC